MRVVLGMVRSSRLEGGIWVGVDCRGVVIRLSLSEGNWGVR